MIAGELFVDILPLAGDFEAELKKQVEVAASAATKDGEMFAPLSAGALTAERSVTESLGGVASAAVATEATFARTAEGMGGSARKFSDALMVGDDIGAAWAQTASGFGRDGTAIRATLDEVGEHATATGSLFDRLSGVIGSGFVRASNTMRAAGIPLGGELNEIGNKFKEAETQGEGFAATMTSVGGLTAAAAAVAGIAFIDMGSKFETSTTQMAAAGNIPIGVANQIGQAFLHSGSDVVYSAKEQEEAFGGVAGQMAAVQGRVLTVAQTTEFMSQAMDLAEEAGANLNSSTKDLSGVMQAFQIPLEGVGAASTDLFNASRITGTGIDSLTSSIDRMKARLGVAAPTLTDLSSLLVDLAEHGVTGSRGLMVVNTATTTLLKSAETLRTAQENANAAFSAKVAADRLAVAKAQDTLNLAEGAGHSTAATVAADQLKLAEAQKALAAYMQAGVPAVKGNALAIQDLGLHVYTASGSFVGMDSIIGQLQPKLAHMTQEQQLATLAAVFGGSANKALLDTVLAGPAAYEKAQKAVTDTAAAHQALVVQQQTLGHELESIKVLVENFGTELGVRLLPYVHDTLQGFADFIGYLENHKGVLETFGAILGTVLVAALADFAAGLVATAAAWAVSPFGAITLAVIALTAATVWLTDHFGLIRGLLIAAASGVVVLTAAFIAFDAVPVVALVAAIGLAVVALVAGIVWLVENWRTVWGEVKAVTEDAWKFIQQVFHSEVVGDIIAPFLWLAAEWKGVWGDITGTAEDAWQFLQGVWEGAVAVAKAVWGVVATVITDVWNVIYTVIHAIWTGIKDYLTVEWTIFSTTAKVIWLIVEWAVLSVWKQIDTSIRAVWGPLRDFLVAGWRDFVGVATVAWQAVSDAITAVWRALDAAVRAVWTPLSGFLESAWVAFAGIARTLWQAVSDAITAIWHVLDSVIRAIWGPLRDFLKNEWTLFASTARTLWQPVETAILAVWHALDAAVRLVWTTLKTYFSTEWTTFARTAGTLWSGITTSISKAWSALTGLATGVWQGVKSAFTSGVNDVIGIINDFIRLLDKVPGVSAILKPIATIGGGQAAGGAGPSGTHAPGAAAGAVWGVYDSPTVLVGEGSRHHPEVVIPTDPQYRQNAIGLIGAAVQMMGHTAAAGLPRMASGGFLTDLNPIHLVEKGVGVVGGALSGLAGLASTVGGWVLGTITKAMITPAENIALAGMAHLPAPVAQLGEAAIRALVDFILRQKPAVPPGGGFGGGTSAIASGGFAANQALGQQMAAGYGWVGPEWLALNAVEMDEAGWNPTAKNKTSSAYGIAQFINGPGEYAQYGGNSFTVPGQITGFLNYVKARYGDPLAALAHENQFHWYDQGGVLPPGLTMAYNGTGKDEYVVNPGRAGGGGGPQVTIGAGAVLVEVTVGEGGAGGADAGTIRTVVQAAVTDALEQVMQIAGSAGAYSGAH